MALKRDKYDDVFSACIREAAQWTCERCGHVDVDGQMTGKSRFTHCSHIFGRRNRSVRWHPDNALCLCATCHDRMGNSPIEHAALARKILGDTRHDALIQLAYSVMKWTPSDKAEMYAHYKAELERIKASNAQGVRTSVVSYQ